MKLRLDCPDCGYTAWISTQWSMKTGGKGHRYELYCPKCGELTYEDDWEWLGERGE